MIQNSLLDVHSLMKIIAPESFGSPREFQQYYITPINRGFLPGSSSQDRSLMMERISELNFIISARSFRTKEVDSIQKTITNTVLFLTPTPDQVRMHSAVMKEANDYFDPANEDHHNIFQIAAKSQSVDHHLDINHKLGLVEQILTTAAKRDDKVVIFVTLTESLLEVTEYLRHHHPQSRYKYLQGNMTSNARSEAVRAFNNESETRVIVIMMGTGSVGISLVSGNVVLFYNTSWNPYIEYQAMSRVNR